MNKIKKLFSHVDWKKVFSKENIFFFAIFLLYLSNAFHEHYPDEYDNLLGGKLILKGVFPYISYMAHHGPVAYFLAAVLQIFSGFHIARFRIVYAIFLTLLLKFISDRFLKKFGNSLHIKIFAVLSGISLMYFWFHMLLADTLSGFLLLFPYTYLIFADLYNKKLNKTDLGLVNIFLFLTVLTSISYSFFVLLAYLFLAYLYLKHNKVKSLKELMKIVWIIAFPYIIFFAYLIATKSMSDYFFQNYTYNKEFYIDYPKAPDGQPVSTLRYAIVLAKNTLDTVLGNIPHVLRFNLYEVKTVSVLGMSIFFLLYLMIQGKSLSALFVIGMILFTNTRVTNVELSEIGYQQSVYILLSLANGAILLKQLIEEKRDNTYKSFLVASLMLGNVLYVSHYSVYMFNSYTDKVYKKFMGEAPLVYDRPEMAPVLNALLDKSDYGWIGPFYHDELYYADFQVPSRYYWILPASAKSDKIVSEMKEDFAKNKPKAIIFNTAYSAFGADAKVFTAPIRELLDSDYTRIKDIVGDDGQPLYNCLENSQNFQCNSFLFIRNDQINTLIEKMLKLNMLEKLVD